MPISDVKFTDELKVVSVSLILIGIKVVFNFLQLSIHYVIHVIFMIDKDVLGAERI